MLARAATMTAALFSFKEAGAVVECTAPFRESVSVSATPETACGWVYERERGREKRCLFGCAAFGLLHVSLPKGARLLLHACFTYPCCCMITSDRLVMVPLTSSTPSGAHAMSRTRNEEQQNASAYRVAHLLQRGTASTHRELDASSLRQLTAEVATFLEAAPQVPPVYMEDGAFTSRAEESNGPSPRQCEPALGELPEVELSVVAGVFEERPPIDAGSTDKEGGVLLPTEANKNELHKRKGEEAQALLNLLSALTPSGASSLLPPEAAAGKPLVQEVTPNDDTHETGGGDRGDDDDDSSVVLMDADDLDNEETSDDEAPAQRRRVVEELEDRRREE